MLPLEKTLEQEVLKSERLRANILILVFALFTLVWTLFIVVSRENFHQFMGEEASVFLLPGYFALITLYFLFMRLLVQRYIEHKTNLPIFVRYLNAFVEVSIPTLAIIVIAQFRTPAYVLLMPPILAYYLFIALSSLTLNEWLCRFSGFVAAIEYAAVSYYFLNYTNISVIDPFLTGWYGFAARTLILLIGGFITAFITKEIKKRLTTAFNAQKERERIESIFGQHVSPEVASKLLSQDANASEYIPVCVMFLDIRNFTHFSEENKPAVVVKLLNHLFDYMIEIIHEHKGIINKFLGDGFMAVFGVPVSNQNDVANAVNAALTIIERTQEEIKKGSLPDIRLGIGIHFGHAITGNIGTKRRLEYTVIGDVVNSTAHLEQLNKVYHTQVLISEEAAKKLPNIQGKFIGSVNLKHRDEPIKIYRLV